MALLFLDSTAIKDGQKRSLTQVDSETDQKISEQARK